MELIRLRGNEARPFVNDLAGLRLKVFYEFPYLYEGTLEYEKRYLETYFKAQNSFVLLVKDQDQVVGATTGIWAEEEEKSFKKPFLQHGLDPARVFYFAESVLLPEYRGKGLGKVFFEERMKFAQSLGFIDYVSFCAVERPSDHPLKPEAYRPLDSFWISQGFKKEPGLTTQYEWPDRNETQATFKTMQYWIKKL